MVRTIYVVFTNIRLSDPQVRNMKQYKFLCPYDMIQVGDMIEDDRYSQRMQVVGCTQCVNSELMGYDYIKQLVKREATSVTVSEGEVKKITVHSKLAIVAKYFNGSWKKTTCNTGYFIGNYNSGNGPVVETLNGVGVYQHNTVQYAGVVYFKNQEDAIKAVKILGESVKDLF